MGRVDFENRWLHRAEETERSKLVEDIKADLKPGSSVLRCSLKYNDACLNAFSPTVQRRLGSLLPFKDVASRHNHPN